MQFKINSVMHKFNFRGQLGFLQFWEASFCNDMVHMVAGQLYRLNGNHEGLTDYRATCLNYETFIGPDTHVDQEFFAGLAAQSGFAEQRTVHDHDQIMGQLVMPNENLTTPEEKTVKVEYENITIYRKDIIKFSLHWMSARMNDLWREVTQRFKRVKQDAFQIKYVDHNNSSFPIFSDHDPRACIADSSWNDMKIIRMLIT
ncbi:hypothetical protein E3N88_30862 [Mikania micrantha]|uniref:PB1 domain-containing protein n=1 Tax=Mikania micrantha TaxID=192012 RepID=A0A5N6MNE4_9ASTR|nr:hypothetical protein E3N88_30862 [Mikania micrantha]